MNRVEQQQIFSALLHELGQPLSSISNFSFAARQHVEQSTLDSQKMEELKAWVQRIEEQSQHVTEMIGQLRALDLTRSQWQAIQLGNLVEQAWQVVSKIMCAEKHQLCVACPEDIPPVFGDQNQLETMLVNLIKIASRWGENDGAETVVDIAARRIEDRVEITIAQAEAASEVAEKALSAFRFTQTLSRWISLSHGSVLQHEASDQGLKFSFTLPISEIA